MIRVFHMPRSRSTRVVWMLEEMGLPYETEPVNLRDPSTEFLVVNPAGTLPAMVDGEVILTESTAILQYLADRYGPTDLSVKPTEPGYADYLQFLLFGEGSLAAPMNPVIGTRFFAPEDQRGDNISTLIACDGYVRRLRVVERQLERGDYMAAGRFTAADISVAYALGLGMMLGLAEQMSPAVHGYYRRMTERPAYQRVIPAVAA